MIRFAILLGALLTASCVAPEARPTRAQIVALEAAIVMPEGAQSLSAYARFYSTRDGQLVQGEMFTGDLEWMLEHRTIIERLGPKTFLVTPENMPGIMDGGCSVLTLNYSTQTGELQGPACNGMA